jgi:hypothetical protein
VAQLVDDDGHHRDIDGTGCKITNARVAAALRFGNIIPILYFPYQSNHTGSLPDFSGLGLGSLSYDGNICGLISFAGNGAGLPNGLCRIIKHLKSGQIQKRRRLAVDLLRCRDTNIPTNGMLRADFGLCFATALNVRSNV